VQPNNLQDSAAQQLTGQCSPTKPPVFWAADIAPEKAVVCFVYR